VELIAATLLQLLQNKTIKTLKKIKLALEEITEKFGSKFISE